MKYPNNSFNKKFHFQGCDEEIRKRPNEDETDRVSSETTKNAIHSMAFVFAQTHTHTHAHTQSKTRTKS